MADTTPTRRPLIRASLIRAWWDRLRGRLEPTPCPFSDAFVLDAPVRRLFAGPDRVVGAFNLQEGERVVEIGPGTGYYSVDAAQKVGPSGLLVCLDIQREMLAETRRRLEASGCQALFIQANAANLPLRSHSLDHVFLIGVLGEIPDRSGSLAEFHRVLRESGRLSVSEQLPDPDFVTKRTLRRDLHAAGFIEVSTRGHLWYTSTWQSIPVSPAMR
jgi:ubiquinone/menaquinone biosynthesis C-methylase UbiE